MTLCSAGCRVSIKTVKASYDKHDLHTVHFIAIYFQIGEYESSCMAREQHEVCMPI